MFEPYAGTDNIGVLFYEPEEFSTLITRLDAEKFQIFIHAIGDRGINTALNALEVARKVNGAPAAPHQLVHFELLQPGDVKRFAELDATATIRPTHMAPDVALQ